MSMTMTRAQPFIAELEREAESTRRFIERVPADKLTWRPHAKSMTLGQLALHIATTPGQVAQMSQADTMPRPEFGQRPQPETVAEILGALDESIATAKRILSETDDDRMMQPWRVVQDDQVVFELPRMGLLRTIMCSHWYHHRGQLSVYLRLLDVPVPSAYGPTADEDPMAAK